MQSADAYMCNNMYIDVCICACLPSGRRNTKGGRIAVVVGSPESIDDGIFGYGARPKARKRRGVAVAKVNDGSLVLFVQILF